MRQAVELLLWFLLLLQQSRDRTASAIAAQQSANLATSPLASPPKRAVSLCDRLHTLLLSHPSFDDPCPLIDIHIYHPGSCYSSVGNPRQKKKITKNGKQKRSLRQRVGRLSEKPGTDERTPPRRLSWWFLGFMPLVPKNQRTGF